MDCFVCFEIGALGFLGKDLLGASLLRCSFGSSLLYVQCGDCFIRALLFPSFFLQGYGKLSASQCVCLCVIEAGFLSVCMKTLRKPLSRESGKLECQVGNWHGFRQC